MTEDGGRNSYSVFVALHDYDQARRDHYGWVTEFLGKGPGRDKKWTEGIAVGSMDFADTVKVKLGIWGRKKRIEGLRIAISGGLLFENQ